jgi:hypothetical protein
VRSHLGVIQTKVSGVRKASDCPPQTPTLLGVLDLGKSGGELLKHRRTCDRDR